MAHAAEAALEDASTQDLVAPAEAAGPPGLLESHILALREALAGATAGAAAARGLAEQQAEALEVAARQRDTAEAERDSALAAADEARRSHRAAYQALADRRSWEIVAHAAQRNEAAQATQAARAVLAAATARFQAASEAIVILAEREAAALRQQAEAVARDRDAAQRALAARRPAGPRAAGLAKHPSLTRRGSVDLRPERSDPASAGEATRAAAPGHGVSAARGPFGAASPPRRPSR